MRVALVLLAPLLIAAATNAWKWGSLFNDGDSDSVVTVAADSRGVIPVFRTYR